MKLKSLCEEIAAIESTDNVAAIRQLVINSYDWLRSSFTEEPINELVTGRAVFVDTLLQHLWRLYGLAELKGLALCAVGGYGRGHLQPYSDIDLLIVSKKTLPRDIQDKIGQFITLLWDIKLDIGQSVRTIKETVKLAKGDISIATNLVESRMLCGCDQTFVDLWHAVNEKDTWTSQAFFAAKYDEQKARHAKFNGTSYNLEPNVKENPGCLRDIQSIGWVAKKHFKEYDGQGLVGHGYFTQEELDELVECRMALWRIRFALHLVAGRSENRLLFDYQPDVATLMGYGDDNKTSVEKMMRAFFRNVRRVSELNQMLLQRFRYDMLNQTTQHRHVINDDYCILDDNISPIHDDVFSTPEDILDFLKIIADHPEIKGLDTSCIRALRNARRRFQSAYYVKREACRIKLMALFRHPHFFDFAWDIMHQYGILQAYLPEWDHIVGMMQFDLFHAYTVDEHTHRLVKHVNHYFSRDNKAFPRCGRIVRNLDKPELLYIAAIFHDIAKGRNGDHSTLGAKDVALFCDSHGIASNDAELIAWLVENHLLMSVVAQRRDIYDPEVVNDFATAVRSHTHLNLLYVLTLADIRATNDNLWNDWKSSLLRELYSMTQKALDNGLQCGATMRERVDTHKQKATQLLKQHGTDADKLETLWSRFEDDYFARFKPEQISWHSREILAFEERRKAGDMLIKTNNELAKGGTELLLYGDDRPALFAQIASVLDSRNCSIHDAHIAVTRDGHVFDSILILENDGSRIEGESRLRSIESAIEDQLLKPGRNHNNTRKLSRKHKQLDVPVKVRFYSSQDDATLIELEALDAPGILAKVGHAFVDCKLTLKLAKIATIGERAEDVFIVSNEQGKALTPEEQTTLKKRILFKLDQLEDINIP
ncbi:[protein-PII] uridylyltransferase [Alteromonas gilva]|uniref:Bifunctional uridylyltransferase/uridylyl-removing enzyme n=1 Tax=Alteromonas gilva TaxID=2987522 RepID=A0ABT5L052_9ALTE|nr:[protein-PII] uridylyltransferase [Alteromonas gilva]MDC8830401.1 [protein-PII] uridylyltransferase [Alteromonas gilva]